MDTTFIPLPKGTLQRDTLVQATHGPAAMLKGRKQQLKALVRWGFLDEDLVPTDKGRAAYDELARPMPFWFVHGQLRGFGPGAGRYANPSDVCSAVSADGRTVYLVDPGLSGKPFAVAADDVPSQFREQLGLKPRPHLRVVELDTDEPRRIDSDFDRGEL